MVDLRNNQAHLSLIKIFIAAVMISFSGVWVKISHVTPTASAFYRVFIGGVILFFIAMVRGEFKGQGGRRLILGFACGLLFAVDLVLYHYAIHLIGPGLGTILPNFQVFILAIIGIVFLKEKLRLITLLSMPLAFIGLFMIVGIDWRGLEHDYQVGLACGFATAVCYTGVLLLLRKLQSDQLGVSVFSTLMLVSLTAAVFIAVEMFRLGDSFIIPDVQSLLALSALGVLSQVIGWILITNALPHIRASLSGLVLLLQPALSFVWDVLFFQRPTSTLNWLGVAVALAAIYWGATARSQAPKKPASH